MSIKNVASGVEDVSVLTQQRDDLANALRVLMRWQVKNVDKWDNPAYDSATETLKKMGYDDNWIDFK